MSARPTGGEMTRWEPTATMTAAEQQAVTRLRRMAPPSALSEDAWGRIHGALFTPPPPAPLRRRTKVATLGVVGLGLVAAAGLHLAGRRAAHEAGRPAEAAVVTGVVAPPSPPAVPLALEPVPAPHAPTTPARHRRPPSPGVAPAEDLLDAESRQLGKALQQLRIEKNASAALETLSEYRTRFPSGLLSGEARLAEFAADLALGRSAEALQLLDEGSLSGGSGLRRDAELDLLRAELLVDLGRCAEALPGLERRVAAGPGDSRLSARALYLRAVCAARDSDGRASLGDLEEYLRRFPDQGDRAAVEEALHRMRAP